MNEHEIQLLGAIDKALENMVQSYYHEQDTHEETIVRIQNLQNAISKIIEQETE